MFLYSNPRNSRWPSLVLSLVICAACLHAQAQSDSTKDTPPKPKYGVNKPLGDTYVAVQSVADEQTRLVLYRAPISSDKAADKSGVVSVYLNDRYHASLQKESFSVICLTGKRTDVRSRYLASHNADIVPELDTRHTVAIKGGQSVYLRVAEQSNASTRIDVVSAQVAANDLADARQQMHTLSRVPGAQPCREAGPATLKFDPNVITFGSDAIFEHRKTEISAITPLGKQELKQIIDKINIKYKTFNDVKVHVVGFADDERDEALNQRISQQRAKSVRAYFQSQGLRTTTLTYEGRGSQEKSRAEVLDLSPRRVEVEVAVDIR